MAFDEDLAQRIREAFGDAEVSEKRMFGGVAFMLRGNMCVGIIDDVLMARVGPKQYETSLKQPNTREMDFTGKPMRGFIYVDPDGVESDADLLEWIKLCHNFAGNLPPK